MCACLGTAPARSGAWARAPPPSHRQAGSSTRGAISIPVITGVLGLLSLTLLLEEFSWQNVSVPSVYPAPSSAIFLFSSLPCVAGLASALLRAAPRRLSCPPHPPAHTKGFCFLSLGCPSSDLHRAPLTCTCLSPTLWTPCLWQSRKH